MSKNIIIKKNGVDTTFSNIAKIRVKTPDGNSKEWVPADECDLGQLSVTANGTYKASESGFYGFSKAIVNVPETNLVLGADPDTGKLSAIFSYNGVAKKTVTPAKILITHLPNKTTYVDGETIDYDGLIVKVYNLDGTLFKVGTFYYDQSIPSSQLVKPVETATYGMTKVPVHWVNIYTSHVMTVTFDITVTR